MAEIFITTVAVLGILYLISPTIRVDITSTIEKVKAKISTKKTDK